MSSAVCFTLFIGATALERLGEMWVSTRNAAWSFTRGGKEYGRAHFPFMVMLHSGFLLACVLEVWILERPFVVAIAIPMIGLAITSQALRWWCISTLGQRWNTRVIIVPGLQRIKSGPYRFFSHPNYVAVVMEGLALPLIHSAWLTAIGFTMLNAVLLSVRIQVENNALQMMEQESGNASR